MHDVHILDKNKKISTDMPSNNIDIINRMNAIPCAKEKNILDAEDVYLLTQKY